MWKKKLKKMWRYLSSEANLTCPDVILLPKQFFPVPFSSWFWRPRQPLCLHFFCSLSVLTCMCASTRSHSMLLCVGHAAPCGTEGLSGCHGELLNVTLSDVTSRWHGARPLRKVIVCGFVAVILEKAKRNDWLVIQILSTLGYVVLRGLKEITKINSSSLKEIRAW